MTGPNRIDLPGTDEQTWRRWPAIDNLPVVDTSAWNNVAVIAAHPDDEVLGAGGTMAMLAAAGVRLRLIALTDGEASHPDADPVGVARTRIDETMAALRALGAADIEIVRLGLPDSRLDNRHAEIVALLRLHCDGFDACLAPWEQDAHADHEAAGRAARLACPNLLMYPVWMWHWASPADGRVPWQRAGQVPLTELAAARKQRAIKAFTSQLTARGPAVGPVVSQEVAAHFIRQQEVFIR